MTNSFDIEVCFDKVPLKPYEWGKVSYITNIKVLRVSTKTLHELLTFEAQLNCTNKVLLLSDTLDSIVVKLDKDGKITKRSFLTFERDLCVSEYACNLKMTKLDVRLSPKKLLYNEELEEERQIKEYLISSITSSDEDKTQYLYYLYFGNVMGYSKKKLLETIKTSTSDKCMTLYKFLIES